MERRLFEEFASIAYRQAGIRLGAGKEALVGARIAKRLRALGLTSPKQYLAQLQSSVDGEELIHFLDVISTNFTSFFREPEHFELLSEWVLRRLGQKRIRMRFWSAASSSGEEPYSMAIAIAEVIRDANVDWRILATDISTRILAAAELGCYRQSSLSALPKHLRHKHFARVDPRGADDPLYQISPELRARVVFRRLNLSAPPFPMRGPFDAVFCRNVMIYFDQGVRQRLVSAIERLVAKDGLFLVGHSETLSGVETQFRAIRPSVYCLSSTASQQAGTEACSRGLP